MRVTFCDLCNASVPQADLDRGTAVIRKGRVVCATCEAVMTRDAAERAAVGEAVLEPIPLGATPPRAEAAKRDPLGAPGATRAGDPAGGDDTTLMDPSIATPLVASRATAPAGSVGATIAVALASVSLITTVGVSAWLYDRVARTGRELETKVENQDNAWREATNSMEVRLRHTIRDTLSGVNGMRDSIDDLNARFDSLGVGDGGSWTDLRDELARLDGKIGALDQALASATGGDAKLDQLAETTAELHDAVLRLKGRVATLEGAKAEVARTVEPPAEPQPAEEPAWTPLLGDLKDQDPGVRWQAVQSLGKTKDPAVAEHLAAMLKDPDIFVRMATARILGDLGATIGIPALIDALEDPEASVREAAVVSLRAISGRTFRFDPGAKDIERAKRVKAWRDWWKKQEGEGAGSA